MLLHIGLQYPDKARAEKFFGEILGLPKQKEFILQAELSRLLFGTDSNVEVVAYGDDKFKFEVFITKGDIPKNFNHVCWAVKDKNEFIEVCKKNNIDHVIVEKDGKLLTFIRDLGGNVYEIKEL
jgi:catechol 2,3-dioxygenase-like lactoylglutathione lyase family enzyme